MLLQTIETPEGSAPRVELVPIPETGALPDCRYLPPIAVDVCGHTAESYRSGGFRPPWIGYLVLDTGVNVGTCAFKTPPEKGRVEIAYFIFPGFEGKGYATLAASRLIDIARTAVPDLTVAARTLSAPGASVRLLRKLGFLYRGSVEHPDNGLVWDWELPPS